MERIKRFPCPNCKKITDGDVISKTRGQRNQDVTIVEVKVDCCGVKFTEYYTKFDLHHYGIKNIGEVVLLNN